MGPDGRLRAPDKETRVQRPVFSKTGIDSHSDDGFNSVAVAAAVWYCKPVGYCNSCVAVVVVKTSRRRICRP